MRKIISGLFISLDNVVESPDKWHFPYFNDEMGAAVDAVVQRCDTALFGRRTYEEFASYWPQQPQDEEFSGYINTVPKLVVSRTLRSTDWANSTIIGGDDPFAELRRIKEGPGGDISVTGSGTLVRGLLEAGLLDELRLLVHPVVAGTGRRLWEGETGQVPLKLLESVTFETGVQSMIYAPADR